MFYIGIDIAKRSHQAAVTDVSGNIIVKPFNFKNTAAGFTQFLSVLETNSVSKDNFYPTWRENERGKIEEIKGFFRFFERVKDGKAAAARMGRKYDHQKIF